MPLITSTNNPTLYAKLYNLWLAQRWPGWILDGSTHYRVISEVSGQAAFEFDTNRALYDSRSLSKSRTASYSNLEE